MSKEMTRKKKATDKEKELDPEKRAAELMEELVGIYGISREAILGRGGLVETMTKRAIEAALSGELTHFLGYEKGAPRPQQQAGAEGQEPRAKNCRNGYSTKKLLGAEGQQM